MERSGNPTLDQATGTTDSVENWTWYYRAVPYNGSTLSPGSNTTDDSLVDEVYEQAKLVFLWLTAVVSSLGVLGNIVSFWVWQAQTSYNATTFLFKSLAVWDTVFLMIVIIYNFEMNWFSAYKLTMCLFLLGNLAQLLSVHITLLVTVSRWVAVRYPLHAQRLLTRWRVWLSCLVVFVWCVALEVLEFTFLEVLPVTMDQYLQVRSTKRFIGLALPLVVLLILNVSLLRTVHRRPVDLGQVRVVSPETRVRQTDILDASDKDSKESSTEAGQKVRVEQKNTHHASDDISNTLSQESEQETLGQQAEVLDANNGQSKASFKGTAVGTTASAGREHSQPDSKDQDQDLHEKKSRQLSQTDEKPPQPHRDTDNATDHPNQNHRHGHRRHVQEIKEKLPKPNMDDDNNTTDHPYQNHRRHLQQIEEKPSKPHMDNDDNTTDHPHHHGHRRSAAESRRQRVTATVLCVSVSSFIAYPVDVIVEVIAFEMFDNPEDELKRYILLSVMIIFQVINSGMNVIFYAALVSKFRHLARLRVSCCRRLLKGVGHISQKK